MGWLFWGDENSWKTKKCRQAAGFTHLSSKHQPPPGDHKLTNTGSNKPWNLVAVAADFEQWLSQQLLLSVNWPLSSWTIINHSQTIKNHNKPWLTIINQSHHSQTITNHCQVTKHRSCPKSIWVDVLDPLSMSRKMLGAGEDISCITSHSSKRLVLNAYNHGFKAWWIIVDNPEHYSLPTIIHNHYQLLGNDDG